jgi:hypothetical protein
MSIYNITLADVVPDRMPNDLYLRLISDTPSLVFTDLSDIAETIFTAALAGTISSTQSLAIARPYVIDITVYQIHYRKASANPDYLIPDAVLDAYQAALDWAKTTGHNIAIAEGGTATVPSAITWQAPATNYQPDQLEAL